MPLLVGTDGVQKMSQSLGNYIAITEPPDDMYGKLVSVPDALTAEYRRLLLDFFTDPAEADRVAGGVADGTLDPWSEKRRMAHEVVDLYHGAGSGEAAEDRFERLHRDHEVPTEVSELPIPPDAVSNGTVFLPRVLVRAGFASSNSEGRRAIEGGGVRLDGEVVRETDVPVDAARHRVLSLGRRRFVKLV
jgi:tyrosyl-tRNA synthetase